METSANVVSKNLIIAEFVGCEIIEDYRRIYVSGDFFEKNNISISHKYVRDENLKFHSDWNWIMPVIKICHEIAPPNSDYWRKADRIKYTLNFSSFLNNDIVWTWASVLDFIDWYNKKKKNN